MPHDRFAWPSRMKSVEREYSATRQAVDQFLGHARLDPMILRGDLRPRDVQHASDRLEGTYVIRLFAEFETGLRLFWGTVRRTRPGTEHLINSLAGMRGVPATVLADVHNVRDYRNDLVHEREGAGKPISIGSTRSSLCKFFDRLPLTW